MAMLCRHATLAALCACVVTDSGCYTGRGGQADGSSSASAGDGSADGGEAGEAGGDDASPPTERESSPGVRLLTQREFHNSVRDLLGVTLDRSLVPREQIVEGHGHISWAQGVGLEEVEIYYELGEQAAQQAVATLALGCDLDAPGCVDPFVEDLLLRAFREPSSAEQIQDYLGILAAPEAGDDAAGRLETLIATVLSSPRFLYVRELGVEAVDGQPHVRWLDDYEIAARMSLLVWQSLPDRPLLDAAAAGELRDPEVRASHLVRMLDDARARPGQVGFVRDWMGVVGQGIADKDPEVLEGTATDLDLRAEQSLERTIEDVLFDGAQSFAALLNADQYWVDGELAALLDLEVADAALEPRALDTSVRRGLLMHPTVLAAHTKESGASPFLLGRFVYENLLCEVIPPPAELPAFEPEPAGEQTLREQLEAFTAAAECQGCHGRIGPPGFAFLAFDPIGRHSAADGLGRPYDTSGTIPVGTGTVSFGNAAELAAALAEHEQTTHCLARRVFRWSYGYFEGVDTEDGVTVLFEQLLASDTGMPELLSTLMTSDAFAQVRRGGE